MGEQSKPSNSQEIPALNSDEQIIENFHRSGNPADWEELVRRHFDRIHGLAFKMTSDRLLADDITQDVFLKVVSALIDFEGRSKFSTWLYRIAMNTIYTRLKKESKTFPSISDANNIVSTHSATPDQIALRSELVTEIDREIKNLKPEFRAAIVLTALQGFPPGEAAKIEGCTAETMYWRLNQARNQLKKELNRYLKP